MDKSSGVCAETKQSLIARKKQSKARESALNKKMELTTIALRKGCTILSICHIKPMPSTQKQVQNRQTAVLTFKLTNTCMIIRYFMVKDNDSRHVSEYELALQHCTAQAMLLLQCVSIIFAFYLYPPQLYLAGQKDYLLCE